MSKALDILRSICETDAAPAENEAGLQPGQIKDLDWDGPCQAVILGVRGEEVLIARLGDWSDTNELKLTTAELKEMERGHA